MVKWKRVLRYGFAGALLAAVCFGIVAEAKAWGEWEWRRQLGTEIGDDAYGVATDAAGNVYLTGYTDGSLGGPNRGSGDAWVAKLKQND